MTRVQRYLQNNGHLYRTQSTVYLKKKSSSVQGFWIISIALKRKQRPLDPGGRTRIYRKQTKLFVAVLFMWSLHCASLYHVLIKKKKKNTKKTLINCLPNECTAKKKKKNPLHFWWGDTAFYSFSKCSHPFSNYLRV